jgi:hypothetical protein
MAANEVGRFSGHTVHQDFAFDRRERQQRRGFPRPVRTQKADHFSRFDREMHVADDRLTAVARASKGSPLVDTTNEFMVCEPRPPVASFATFQHKHPMFRHKISEGSADPRCAVNQRISKTE